MTYQAKNNAFSTLAGSLTNVATTLTVQAGHGDRFPVIAAPDYTLVTLEDNSGNREIVKVTARASASDSMTIVRAQEGTTARAWASGDSVELRLTAGEIQTVFNHVDDTTDAHAASAITNTPSGNLAATTVQAALNELQTDVDTRELSINAATAKVTPVDADTTALIDSADANKLKKVTWANVKATLKAYFDTLYIAAGSIVGLTDGDKGDITVSGSGSSWSIDNDAVTYAKMQNVSATARVIGRKTAAAGDPEEVTLSELLDFIGSAAQGDILYRGASAWARLPAGTSGNFLKTQGAGANPTWDAAGGITLLGTLTTTSGSTAVLGSLSLTNYSKLFVVVNGVSFTSNVFITINSNQVSAPLGTTFTDALYGFIDIDLTSSIGIGIIQSSTPPLSSALLGTAGRIFNSGLTTASTSITFAGGTFDAGSIKVYGVK